MTHSLTLLHWRPCKVSTANHSSLSLSELGAIFNTPAIKFSVSEACESFTLSIQCCAGVFGTVEGLNGYKLNLGVFPTGSDLTYTFPDLEAWLEMKS